MLGRFLVKGDKDQSIPKKRNNWKKDIEYWEKYQMIMCLLFP